MPQNESESHLQAFDCNSVDETSSPVSHNKMIFYAEKNIKIESMRYRMLRETARFFTFLNSDRVSEDVYEYIVNSSDMRRMKTCHISN